MRNHLLFNRSATGINSIGQFSAGGFQNVITLTADHDFLTGESVRVISDSDNFLTELTQIAFIILLLKV